MLRCCVTWRRKGETGGIVPSPNLLESSQSDNGQYTLPKLKAIHILLAISHFSSRYKPGPRSAWALLIPSVSYLVWGRKVEPNANKYLAEKLTKWGPRAITKECWTLSPASEMFLHLSLGSLREVCLEGVSVTRGREAAACLRHFHSPRSGTWPRWPVLFERFDFLFPLPVLAGGLGNPGRGAGVWVS